MNDLKNISPPFISRFFLEKLHFKSNYRNQKGFFHLGISVYVYVHVYVYVYARAYAFRYSPSYTTHRFEQVLC